MAMSISGGKILYKYISGSFPLPLVGFIQQSKQEMGPVMAG
jgi:hypothetical protein